MLRGTGPGPAKGAGAGRRARSAIVLAVLLGIVLSAPLAQPAGKVKAGTDIADWRLKPTGIGPLRLGMSVRKARSLVPGLRVAHHRFCDTWIVPGLGDVSMFATHSRGGLSSVSISGYGDDPAFGRGARGVEIGDSVGKLKRKFGKRLKFVKHFRYLKKSFYRVFPRGGRPTALEFTIDIRTRRVEFEQAGFRGEFYYTDGVELCA